MKWETCARMTLMVGAALAVASCSGEPPTPATPVQTATVTEVTPGTLTVVPPTTDLSAARLPLSAYIATDGQRTFVDRAYVQLSNQCLGRYGFPPRLSAPTNPAKTAPITWRYGISDPVYARRYGYHTPPELGLPTDHERTDAQRRAHPMPPDELRVYTGEDTSTHGGLAVPDGGCAGEASRRLGARSSPNHMDDLLAKTLAVTAFQQAHNDSRVTSVIAQWATCMRDRGYDETDPLTTGKRFDLNTPTPTGPEIDTATADAHCKQHTHLVTTWYSAETAYHHALIHANTSGLNANRDNINTAVDAAAVSLNEPFRQ